MQGVPVELPRGVSENAASHDALEHGSTACNQGKLVFMLSRTGTRRLTPPPAFRHRHGPSTASFARKGWRQRAPGCRVQLRREVVCGSRGCNARSSDSDLASIADPAVVDWCRQLDLGKCRREAIRSSPMLLLHAPGFLIGPFSSLPLWLSLLARNTQPRQAAVTLCRGSSSLTAPWGWSGVQRPLLVSDSILYLTRRRDIMVSFSRWKGKGRSDRIWFMPGHRLCDSAATVQRCK
ncbi:hypothetical protein L1887_43428 [Cichorium endivia]|nr:hypothetical protein L1887_43428 [Cichorium endivia]